MILVMKQEKFLSQLNTDDHSILRATIYSIMNQPTYTEGRTLAVALVPGRGGYPSHSRYAISLILFFFFFLFPAQASALTKNSPVVLPTLQITVGFEDDSRVNYWTPVQVALSNEGSNFSGMVSVTTYAGFSRQVVVGSTLPWSYQASVVLPHGTQKQINLNIPFYETPAVPQGIVATLSDNKGKVITTQTATPFILHSSSLLIGILSDHTAESPEFSSLSKVLLPDSEQICRIGYFECQHDARYGRGTR